MISGVFEDDIEQYLINLGKTNINLQTEYDLDGVSTPFNGFFQAGKMYTYRYFTPDEKIYDTQPIIIALEYSSKDNLIGLNLHYLPINIRIDLISRIIKSYEPVFSSNSRNRRLVNPELQQSLGRSFNYDNLKKSYQNKFNILYAVRQYRLDRIINPFIIGYENWYIGVANNNDMFHGATIKNIQAQYYTNI